MKRLPWWLVGLGAAALTAAGVGVARERKAHAAGTAAAADRTGGEVAPEWTGFELDDLRRRLAAEEGPWLEFLRVPELRCGLYRLGVGDADPQRPHAEDEVYYVVSGRAVLSLGGDERPVEPGSVVYVRAGVDHRFHSISEELEVVVFFSR